jgi:hypothetical protein
LTLRLLRFREEKVGFAEALDTQIIGEKRKCPRIIWTLLAFSSRAFSALAFSGVTKKGWEVFFSMVYGRFLSKSTIKALNTAMATIMAIAAYVT